MGPEITVFQPDQRDGYGQYRILAGHTHVFAFQVPMFGSIKIGVSHIMPNSQDFSIDIWASEEILDKLVLAQGMGHFKAKRRVEEYEIFCSFLKRDEEDDRLFLPTHQPYFLNVKNLQNRVNAYQLNWD